MITYRMISKQLSKADKQAHKRKQLLTTDPDFKEKMLERVLQNLVFYKGERVRIVNTRDCGVVSNIRRTVDTVNWVNDKPHCIEIVMDEDGSTFLACPYQLTKKRT